jgi:hypothetical protein
VERSWAKFILPLLVVVGGTAWCIQARRPAGGPSGSASAAPSPAAQADSSIALLGGLKPGDAIGEWTVDRLVFSQSPQNQPQLSVELMRKGTGITVWIARKEAATNPPMATERYGLSWGHPRLYGDPIPEGAYDEVVGKLAERIRANEKTAPTPPGL